jgi:hypothetical protein
MARGNCMGADIVKPSDNFDYYSSESVYWNTFKAVRREQNIRISGDPEAYWHHHLLKRYGKQRSAFVFLCGNGWVERSLFEVGAIGRAIAFDIMPSSIDSARAEANKKGLPV